MKQSFWDSLNRRTGETNEVLLARYRSMENELLELLKHKMLSSSERAQLGGQLQVIQSRINALQRDMDKKSEYASAIEGEQNVGIRRMYEDPPASQKWDTVRQQIYRMESGGNDVIKVVQDNTQLATPGETRKEDGMKTLFEVYLVNLVEANIMPVACVQSLYVVAETAEKARLLALMNLGVKEENVDDFFVASREIVNVPVKPKAEAPAKK